MPKKPFLKNELYQITEARGYLRMKCEKSGLVYPPSFDVGGGLVHLADKWGIKPDYTNGIGSHGARRKYNGDNMMLFCKLFIAYLKSNPKSKPRTKKKVEKVDKARDLATKRISFETEMAQLLHERARIDARIFTLLLEAPHD